MRQLSEQDALFLYSDNAHSNSNVTLLHIYDQSTAPDGKVRFKKILAHVESRLDRLPLLRKRLLEAPFGLDRPYWVDDEDFNLEYHVRHIALPKPGDWRQFCIQASRIHARPLDRQRPLWEMYVIEGLDSFLDLPHGSFAVLFKIHHAAIDVESSAAAASLLHDFTPTPPASGPTAPWFPEAPPGELSLMTRALFNMALSPLHNVRPALRAATTVAPAMFARFLDLLRHPEHAVVTRFNSAVSPHRVFDTRRFPLSEIEEVRALAPGASVNDVVFAMCGGALRRYLGQNGELPAASLTATTPLAFHGEKSLSELTWTRLRLGADIDDPVARLAMICEQTSQARSDDADSAYDLAEAARYAPGASLAATSKMLAYAAAQLGRWAPLANCAVASLPGPDAPLYLLGARMTYYSAIMPISDGMGLVFSVTTYDGRAIVSFTSCYELMPDPENFAQCLRDEFQDYLALARAKGAAKSANPAAKRPRAVTKPKREKAAEPAVRTAPKRAGAKKESAA